MRERKDLRWKGEEALLASVPLFLSSPHPLPWHSFLPFREDSAVTWKSCLVSPVPFPFKLETGWNKMSVTLPRKKMKNWGPLKGLVINILIFLTKHFWVNSLLGILWIYWMWRGKAKRRFSVERWIVALSRKYHMWPQRWADLCFCRKGCELWSGHSNFTCLSELCTQFMVKWVPDVHPLKKLGKKKCKLFFETASYMCPFS